MNIFYSITKKLAKIFNNFIDFTRIGSLFTTGHRYSKKELLDRAVIIGGTAATTYMGSRTEVSEQLGMSNIMGAAAGAVTGFVLTHTVVITPLIMKRIEFSKQCEQTKARITKLLVRLDFEKDSFKNEVETLDFSKQVLRLKRNITSFIQEIYQHDYSTTTRANSSQTWGMRLNKLKKLEIDLSEDIEAILNNPVKILEINQRYEIDLNIVQQVRLATTHQPSLDNFDKQLRLVNK